MMQKTVQDTSYGFKGVRPKEIWVGSEALNAGHVASAPQSSSILVLQRLHKHQHLIILVLLDSMYV